LPDPVGASYYSCKPVFKHDSIIISPNDDVGERKDIANRVTVPTFQIYSNPTVKLSDIKTRRFDLIDRAASKAKAEIQAQEDVELFKAIDESSYFEVKLDKPKWKSPIRKMIDYVKRKISR
jgi:hypothetical protein